MSALRSWWQWIAAGLGSLVVAFVGLIWVSRRRYDSEPTAELRDMLERTEIDEAHRIEVADEEAIGPIRVAVSHLDERERAEAIADLLR